MPQHDASTIYVVDDDVHVGVALSRLLRTGGFEVEAYTSVSDFIDRYHANGAGCIVLDVAMGEWNGLDVQKHLLTKGYVHPVVFISGQSELQTCVQAMKAGAVDFLTKPVDADDLFQ